MSTELSEIILRATRARRQFKALVRLTIANQHWLEDVEDEQLTENVKKNIQLLTKKKAKRGLLTIQQKALLNKPAEYRTEEEKIVLNKIIGGLKCFKKYPEHVKMQLAGVTYFAYYGPQRVIVKQNHIAHALYFIISGEVAVSVTTYDPVIKENVTTIVGSMVPGTPCEFLYLRKADFDIVLKDSVKEQWGEIQRAMVRFSYFDGWDAVSVRECCIYSKIKPFVRDQTILGDGTGTPSSIYFILKGQCKLIEHLLLSVSYDKNGRKRYKLYDTDYVPEHHSEEESAVTFLDEAKQSLTSLRTYKGPRSIFPAANNNSGSMVSGQKIKKRRIVTSDIDNGQSSELTEVSQKLSSLGAPQIIEEDLDDPIVTEENELSKSITQLPPNVETHFMQVNKIVHSS
ncbi:hypothetical protein MML48_4g00021914 [Holotrichia oblita]|uniref:Uncharacterized protein n=1 Tax=Holotrichia oblita TaxID=644536 RepID=A0ACB9T9H5_HOLOL|nr:hypothetical protein MML48_4g00021914 [Holotrichia oblita]